jgi:hypothetical protein
MSIIYDEPILIRSTDDELSKYQTMRTVLDNLDNIWWGNSWCSRYALGRLSESCIDNVCGGINAEAMG